MEEAMASRAHSIAPSTSDFALHETSLQYHHGFFEASADDLGEASNNFSIWTFLSILEEQSPSFYVWLLVLCCVPAQQIEDAVVVYFVHGHDNGVFYSRVCWEVNVGDRRRRW